MSAIVGGIKIDSIVTVRKADGRERDMYGGAVNVTVSVAGASASLDLDAEGVRNLIWALETTIDDSAEDYKALREDRLAPASGQSEAS